MSPKIPLIPKSLPSQPHKLVSSPQGLSVSLDCCFHPCWLLPSHCKALYLASANWYQLQEICWDVTICAYTCACVCSSRCRAVWVDERKHSCRPPSATSSSTVGRIESWEFEALCTCTFTRYTRSSPHLHENMCVMFSWSCLSYNHWTVSLVCTFLLKSNICTNQCQTVWISIPEQGL